MAVTPPPLVLHARSTTVLSHPVYSIQVSRDQSQ